MALNDDVVFNRETLYERIWGMEAKGDNASVAVHINRLRDKIEEDPGVYPDGAGCGLSA